MIAYFILVHRYPVQFKRLFKTLYDQDNIYLIHLDKRAGVKLSRDITNFLKDFPNSYLLKSKNVVWGGYSMVEAELRGIKKLLQLDQKWSFFVNLSGQDFPLKPQSFIKKFLQANKGRSFMRIADQAKMRPITLNRIENYFTESKNGFFGAPFKRSFLTNVTPFIGGQWKILSRKCCEFISRSPKVAKFRKFYKNTLIPDEGFFQTVLMNTNYPGEIINDEKRAIIWIPEFGPGVISQNFTANTTKSLVASGKIKLRPKTFTTADLPFLLSSDALFARKFDENIDSKILDALEINLAQSKFKDTSQKHISVLNQYSSNSSLLAV